jgi:hypothetical protein
MRRNRQFHVICLAHLAHCDARVWRKTHAQLKRRRALKKIQNCECQLSSVASERWCKIFTVGVKILHLHCAADLLLIILYFLILAAIPVRVKFYARRKQ